jgi:hypothetical protein
MKIFYLVNTQAFFNLPIDIIIWYMHGSKLAFVNPRPPIVVLPNIKGWTFEYNKTL